VHESKNEERLGPEFGPRQILGATLGAFSVIAAHYITLIIRKEPQQSSADILL